MRGRVMLALLLAVPCAAGTAAVAAPSLHQSFDLIVPKAPIPVTVDGAERLVYELHITNFATVDLELARIEVLDADGAGRRIGDFQDESLRQLLEPAVVPAKGDVRVIASGARTVAYFWLPADDARGLPGALLHRVTLRTAGVAAATEVSVTGARVPVLAERPVVLGAPLRGGPWAAIYFPTVQRGHRRVLFAVDGGVRIPARFAIDWMKLDEQGRFASGDTSRVSNWHGYGADVLAVSDATVAAVRDSMAESDTVAHVAHGLDKEAGNYVTLDLGGGRYVSYEHLKPDSVRVRAGEKVRQGQVIARLGYTGDSSGPHLHLHVSDGAGPLVGEGLPFVLRRFEVLGAYASRRSVGQEPWTPSAVGGPEIRTLELPAALSVLRFPDTEAGR